MKVAIVVPTVAGREETFKGLVYSRNLAKPAPVAWHSSPKFYAAIVIVIFVALNWKFF